MKAVTALPLAIVNGPVVWVGVRVMELIQGTSFEVGMAEAVAIGGLASLLPSAFMAWAAFQVRRTHKLHQEHITEIRPWREEVLQRIQAVETTCGGCDIREFREVAMKFLHDRTDQYQAALSEVEMRVIALEKGGTDEKGA